jgi:hypothetical protein
MKEDRVLDFDYKALYFIPKSKNLYAEKANDKYAYIIDRKGNEVADFAELEVSERPLWYYYFVNERYEYTTIKSDYFEVSDCIKSLLFPTGKTIDNLYGFSDMKPGDCADKIGISLSKDDIIDNRWFPYQTLYQNEFGTISYSLGFSDVVNTYYDDDDYWQLRPHYSYSSSPCRAIRLKLQMNSDTKDHKKQIESQKAKVLESLGFSKSGTNSYDEDSYENSNVEIETFDVNYDYLFVRVSLK